MKKAQKTLVGFSLKVPIDPILYFEKMETLRGCGRLVRLQNKTKQAKTKLFKNYLPTSFNLMGEGGGRFSPQLFKKQPSFLHHLTLKLRYVIVLIS